MENNLEKKQIGQSNYINEAQVIGGDDRGRVTYNVAGQDITLSVNIVKRYLTNGNNSIPESDIIQFISLCKFNELNPFLKEAYLIKYGSQPAQMVVSKEALFKRAENNPHYEGYRAGIIVNRAGNVLDLEGCFFLKEDVLLGGWCEVFRDDRKYPIVARVRLEDYDKRQSIWNEKKATMISKVAKAQAMREAFPAQLGAMYTQEEQSNIDDQENMSSDVAKEINENANKGVVGFEVYPDKSEVVAESVEEPIGEMEAPDWMK